jgi:hypothetical protein
MYDLLLEILRTTTAAVSLSAAGTRVAKGLRAQMIGYRDRRLARPAFLELLGVRSQSRTSFWISEDHPTIDRRAYPDADVSALSALVGREVSDRFTLAEPQEDDHGDSARGLEDNLVLIGSPESEPLTRLLFGYEVLPNGRGLRYRDDTVPLIYRWDEERRAAETLMCLHVRPHGVIAARPNWPLVHDTGELHKIPVRLNNGYLAEDFLLITRIPNFITDTAWDSGAGIINISGLHSVGTRALGMVLDDGALVADIQARLDELPHRATAFQAVIHITSILHDRQNGSRATGVRLRDVVEVPLPMHAMHAARAAVVAAIPKWTQTKRRRVQAAGLGFDLRPPFTDADQRLIESITQQSTIDLDRWPEVRGG